MSYRIRWLHLSDFHVGKDNYEQLKLFLYILKQIQARVAKSPLDFVFITGDVAYSGVSEQYALFHREFLTPLLQLVGPDCQTLIVPGNHDMDRTQVAVSRDSIQRSLNFFDASELGRQKRQAVMPRFQAYHDTMRFPPSWLDTAQGCFVARKRVRGVDVGILGINTAWLAQGDDDKAFLNPGKSLVEAGLAEIQDAHVRIVLGHHPIDWFSESIQGPIQALFGRANVLYLHAHLHQTKASLKSGAEARYLALQSGAAFQAREYDVWRNRILWAQLNVMEHTLEMYPFVWNAEYQEWAVDGAAFPMRFHKNHCWVLPLPGERTFSPPANDEQPFNKKSLAILQRLHIRHFRGFEALELTFPTPQQTQRGQWTVLLGDNGVGKTSLLWAIALALINEELGYAVLAGLPSLLKRTGSENAQIRVDVNDCAFERQIQQVKRREKLITDAEASEFPVFAYGAGRGSALGGANRAVELDRPLDSIGTLFGLSSSLIHAETWLRELEHRSLKGKSNEDKNLFTSIMDTLLQLLPGVDAMEVLSDDVLVRGPVIGECSLACLSDGYLTTIGWVLDLMARWTHEARRTDITIKPGFNQQMTGLVLIDELDLHLHPRWQMHIIRDVRKAFPKMSFIVTTHNPLTLLGAEPGEIQVIRRDEGHLDITQEDIPPGIRADQVLTGAWFGLSSTLDEETRELLETHRRLLSKGTKRSDPTRKALERNLRQRLGSFADTSEDRLALEISAQHMSEDFRSLAPKERAEVQKRIKQALAARK